MSWDPWPKFESVDCKKISVCVQLQRYIHSHNKTAAIYGELQNIGSCCSGHNRFITIWTIHPEPQIEYV